MPWQVVVVLLTAIIGPLVLAYANHKFRQRREREDRDCKARDEMVSRHKQACGELLDGARQIGLSLRLEQDRHESLLSVLANSSDDAVKAGEDGIARMRTAARVLQVEPGTETITQAVRTYTLTASDFMLEFKDHYHYRLPAEDRARQTAQMNKKLTELEEAIRTHLDSLHQQPKQRRWWPRLHEGGRRESGDDGT